MGRTEVQKMSELKSQLESINLGADRSAQAVNEEVRNILEANNFTIARSD